VEAVPAEENRRVPRDRRARHPLGRRGAGNTASATARAGAFPLLGAQRAGPALPQAPRTVSRWWRRLAVRSCQSIAAGRRDL